MEYLYPRVSEILSPYTSIGLANVPADALQYAAERGTAVHCLAVAYARGDFVPHIEPELEPYFNSFQQWYDNHVHEHISSEERIYDHKREYSGQYDLIVSLKETGDLVLVDLKTSCQIQKAHYVQLAAYMKLMDLTDFPITQGYIVHLQKDGSEAKMKVFKEPAFHTALFEKALDLYDFFLRTKGRKKKEASDE